MNKEAKFTVEQVDAVKPPRRARVEDAVEEAPATKLERKRDYLEGFLSQKPASLAPGEPGGELYDSVVAALKEIYDPEIPVNIYDLGLIRSEEHTSELQSLMRISYAVFCLKKKKKKVNCSAAHSYYR